MPVGKRKLSSSPTAVAARERARTFREMGLCGCGRSLETPQKAQCSVCTERNHEDHKRIRELVLAHYGGKCVCCGISEYEFLAMDHKEGNGNQHRQAVTGSKKTLPYRWFIKNNFPPDFQIHCHNCNMAKGLYGACPHEKNRGNI